MIVFLRKITIITVWTKIHQLVFVLIAHEKKGQKIQLDPESKACPRCGGTKSIIFKVFTKNFKLRDKIKVVGKRFGFGRFLELISGWEKNKITGDTKHGVDKRRLINKKNDKYKEKVPDLKTGEVIRDCEEPLSQHRTSFTPSKKRENHVFLLKKMFVFICFKKKIR